MTAAKIRRQGGHEMNGGAGKKRLMKPPIMVHCSETYGMRVRGVNASNGSPRKGKLTIGKRGARGGGTARRDVEEPVEKRG